MTSLLKQKHYKGTSLLQSRVENMNHRTRHTRILSTMYMNTESIFKLVKTNLLWGPFEKLPT